MSEGSDSDDGSNTAPGIVQVKIERWTDDDPETREPARNETEDPLALGPEQTEHFITVEVPLALSPTATMAIKQEPVPAPGDTVGEEIVRQYTFRAAATKYEKVKLMTKEIGRKAIAQRRDLNKNKQTVKEEVRPDSCDNSLSPGTFTIEQWPVPAPGDVVGEEIVRRYTLRAASTTYEKVKPVSKEIRKKGAQRKDINHALTVHEELGLDSCENSLLNQTASCSYKQEPAHDTGQETVRQDMAPAALNSDEQGETLSCEFCKKTFAQLADLEQHGLSVHTGVTPYSCPICNLKAWTREYLAKHMPTHVGERPHACDICGKRFMYVSSLNHHKKVHTGVKPYSCDTCNKAFTHRGSLVQHMLVHTGDKPYSCDVCKKAFAQRSQVNRHKQIHNPVQKPNLGALLNQTASCSYKQEPAHDTSQETVRQDMAPAALNSDEQGDTLSCEFCKKTFAQLADLEQHGLSVHTGVTPYSCPICNLKAWTREYLAKHMPTHVGERPHACDICGKRFMYVSSLNHHKKVHTGVKPYSCDTCNKAFTHRGSLVQHMLVHTGDKPYSCDVCKKAFAQRSQVNRHKQTHNPVQKPNLGGKTYACDLCDRVYTARTSLFSHKLVHMHAGERRFTCEICNKAFMQLGHKKRHMLIHTKEKTFACNVCNKTFLHRAYLAQHMLVHTRDKYFSCDVCDKSFVLYKTMIQHKLIAHEGAKPIKPYSCEICKKKCSTRSHLTQHMLTHTGERPHTCDVCGKRFTHHSTLVNHKRVHTGEKPFTCDICNKSFTQRAQTIKHMQNHARK